MVFKVSKRLMNHAINKLAVVCILLAGCGITEPARKRQSKLSRLDLQATPQDVQSIFGEPDRVRAAGQRRDGKFAKLWEYEIYGNYTALADALLCPILLTIPCWMPYGTNGTLYWLEFVDGKLERWGRAGDWQRVDQDITIHHAPPD